MGWIFGIIIVFTIIKLFSKSTSSGERGEKRAFKCNKCSSKYWIVLNIHHYDEKFAKNSYNYKEWLQCAKCGERITNERHLR